MVRLWLDLLTLLLMKDLVVVMGFQGKHKLRHPRDISTHIGPSGRVQPQESEDFRPRLQLPQGFDPSSAQQQEDGQLCVFKKLSLEGLCCVRSPPVHYQSILSGIEKVPVQQCIHRVDTECYSSYVTQYTPTTEVGQ